MKFDWTVLYFMKKSIKLILLGAWNNDIGEKTSFLMGCFHNDMFRGIMKLSRGFSKHALMELERFSRDFMKKFEYKPKWLECDPFLKPDYIVKKPSETIVFDVTCTNITTIEDDVYFDFPCFSKINEGLEYFEADTFFHLKELKKKKNDVFNIHRNINFE